MLNLYTETPFKPHAPSSTNLVSVQIQGSNGRNNTSQHAVKRHRSSKLASDEKSYATEYLASSSSIYFQHHKSHTRSYLWRVRSNERVLEIRSADFSKHENAQEADVVLALEFQEQISPRGISFIGPSQDADIHLFILTKANEVFECRLNHDYFVSPNSIPADDIASWCNPIQMSSLTIDTAYHIHVSSPHDIFVSFTSGKIQWWGREDGGSQWSQSSYDDKTWGASFMSIVGRRGQPDYEFDGMSLAYNTAHAMSRKGNYLFTICINHSLRVWHLPSGKLVDQRDMLDVAREPNERIQLKPAEPGYVQFLKSTNENEQMMMTYSPYGGGQVKLWRVRSTHEESPDLFSLSDMIPETELKLPDPDETGSSVWSLAGLNISRNIHTRKLTLWVLWRNHNYHKCYSLAFDLSDVSKTWKDQTNWVKTAESTKRTPLPDLVSNDHEDISSRWLDHILFPGRFSDSVLETSLKQYQSMVETWSLSESERGRPLSERLALTVASTVSLRRYDDHDMDYSRFAIDVDHQWRQFCRIAETLNEDRAAPLSLAYSEEQDTSWIVMADQCCVLRESSHLELLRNNDRSSFDGASSLLHERCPWMKFGSYHGKASTLSTFLNAAEKFTSSFSPELLSDFQAALDEDIFGEPQDASPDRVVNFYNEIDFANAIGDDAEKSLTKELDSIGGLGVLSDELYRGIFDLLAERKPRHSKPENIKTAFGVDLTMAGILQEIASTKQTLTSMIAMVIFFDENDRFDTTSLFNQCIQRLRVQERNLWIATHQSHGSSSLLQDLYSQSLRPQPTTHQPLAHVLTSHVAETIDFVSGDHHVAPEAAAVFLQCYLLKKGELRLASEFIKFQPSTAWSTYVKARLSLALGVFAEAALYFKAHAKTLSGGKALGKLEEVSAGLLSAAEAASFNNGPASYYEHVLSLFESAAAYPQVIEFAQATLREAHKQQGEPALNFQQNVLRRLFVAQLALSQSSEAFSTLLHFTDPVLQRACATDLINAVLSPSQSLTEGVGTLKLLESLPWSDVPQLANYLDSHLSDLAKKQTHIPYQGSATTTLRIKGAKIENQVDYLSLQHALRLGRGDYRGAMLSLFDRYRLISRSGRARSDPEATSIRHALLAVINGLAVLDSQEAYIVVEINDDPRRLRPGNGSAQRRAINAQPSGGSSKRNGSTIQPTGEPPRKRQKVVITLDDMRREYQQVLDRCSRIERGDFAFGEDEDEEDDYEDDTEIHNESRLDQLGPDSRYLGASRVRGNGDLSILGEEGADAMEI